MPICCALSSDKHNICKDLNGTERGAFSQKTFGETVTLLCTANQANSEFLGNLSLRLPGNVRLGKGPHCLLRAAVRSETAVMKALQ